jgi:hypothetical protein
MRKAFLLPLLLSCALTSPACAAVLGSTNVALGSTPNSFNVGNASFLFAFDAAAAAQFNPAPYSVQTTGTGQTSAFGGFLGIPLAPSLFDQSGVLINGNLFPSFAAFPALTPIPFSLVPGDLALRYSADADFFYGYARLNGNGTLNFAFESTPNASIIAGAAITGPLAAAVPEPATWGMMLLGFAAIGLSFRRRAPRRALAMSF